ncbi:hypothetical protein IJI55_02570 [Candidatus Saccharibacteria bacterium]|nr:hypothetical protein [Candidatus Saccharibacteria bacterium]
MNPDDDYNNNHDENNRDADKFHIAPEYGEQGEGPGEQPVKKVEHMPTTDGFKKPVSISITEVKAEKVSSAPKSPFNHGADDVMQYFTTEKIEEEASSYKSNETAERNATSLRDETVSQISYKKSEASDTHDGGLARAGLSTQGSDVSPSITTAQNNITESTQKTKSKKKTNLVSTIAIVLITVLLTAVAVFAILILTQGHSKDNKITTNNTETTTVETSSITCTKSDGTDEEKKSAGNATSINTTVIANYTGEDLDDYSVTKRYTYSDSSAAAAGLERVKSTYIDKYVNLLPINQDPFSSTYAQKDKEVTESHFASASDITSENMELINIPRGNNDTVPDISVVESTFKTSGYTCKVKSAE